MHLKRTSSTTFELQGGGFAGMVDVTAGPAFRDLKIGDSALLDWESADEWKSPSVEGAHDRSIRVCRRSANFGPLRPLRSHGLPALLDPA